MKCTTIIPNYDLMPCPVCDKKPVIYWEPGYKYDVTRIQAISCIKGHLHRSGSSCDDTIKTWNEDARFYEMNMAMWF